MTAPIRGNAAAASLLAIALALSIVLPAVTNAGVEFSPMVSYPAGAGAKAVALGDLDGDGDLDAVVGGRDSSQIRVFLNHGDGTYEAGASIVSHPVIALALANVAGGAALDLVVATAYGSDSSATDPRVAVLIGNGDGTFGAPLALDGVPSPSSIATADFDHDGLADVAVSGYPSGIWVFHNSGAGFDAPIHYATGELPRDLEAGDLNGDGWVDLVSGNYVGSVSVLLNHGDGTFEPHADYSGLGYVSCVAIGDLDNDGDADLAVADEYGSVNVLLNAGTGVFAFSGNTPLYGRAECIAMADFDQDGYADVAAPRDDLGQVIALAGRGDGTFYYPALYFATGMGAHGIAVGDVNGDGRLDVVTADMGTGGGDGTMTVLIGGAPRTCDRTDYASGVSPSDVVAADFDGDGRSDLAVANEDQTLSVFIGKGDGTFKDYVRYPIGTLSQGLASADFNGDGRPDIVVSNYTESTLLLFINRGDGTFGASRTLPVGPHPRFVVAVDLNGDGRPDLATANYNDAIYDGSISVMINQGNAQFSAPTQIPAGLGPYQIRAAKLDADDNFDLIVNNYDGQSVSIYLNHGDGTFQPEQRYAVGWGLATAVADFDHDGDNDLAVCNFQENTVSILLNDGAGAFGSRTDIPVGRQPRSIQAAIVRGDQDIDLAVAISTTSEIQLLENKGQARFQTFTDKRCAAGVNPKSLIMADLDANGSDDLITTNSGAGTMSVLLGVAPAGSSRGQFHALKRPPMLTPPAGHEPIHRFALLPSRPNPARGAAVIPFEIPRDASVDLRVFDVAGRVVKTLVSGDLTAGPHETRWDGTSDTGQRVHPGTYFYRLRMGDQQSARVLIFKN
jgi:hypothetical protein